MINPIITQRLNRYSIQTQEDEENALKEILQEIALYALSTTDFFGKALFQGGTALRILYHLPRFSEDLDFILKSPDASFHWEPYIQKMSECFKLFAIEPEITDRGHVDQAIQKLFLKDNSIGKMLNLRFRHHSDKKLFIKLEIDINPPSHSESEIKYLDFPLDYAIVTQDLPSNFAGKCHALLCRPYIKGRDWFDFSWYVANETPINFHFLSSAINQSGPWKEQNLIIDQNWLLTQLSAKIQTLDWPQVSQEVARFVNPEYQNSLALWSIDFFLNKVHKLQHYLKC